MEGKRIIIKGNVQKLAFRRLIKEIAKKHKLFGFVTNLRNYDEDVLIFCEGKKENIKAFIEDIKKLQEKREEANLLLIKIDKIIIEDQPYSGAFTDFEIIRTYEEAGERFDEGAQQLMAMRRDLSKLRKEISLNFSELDTKYHIISQILREISEINKSLVELLKNIK